MTFKQYCARNNPKIFRTIMKYLPSDGPLRYRQSVSEYSKRRGKYGRPNIALLWCEVFGGNPNNVFPFAAAIQAAEDWFLMHDDWMDDNELRRGKPAAHVLYGDKVAINAGDAMQTVMWNIAYAESRTLERRMRDKLFEKLFDIITTTEEGQYRDLELSERNIGDFSLKEYWSSIHAKAAYYSVYGPMQLGAIAAGSGAHHVAHIRSYGIPAGKAFQIKDDILDCVSSDAALGKTIGTDVAGGVKTAILWHFFRNASLQDKKRAERIYAKPRTKKTKRDIAFILSAFQRTGSIAYAEDLADSLARDARNALNEHLASLPKSPYAQTARDAIAGLVNRTR